MRYLKDQYKELCPGVYVWENFLSQDELVPIMEEILSSDWTTTDHVRGLESFLQYKQRILDSVNMPDASLRDLDHCVVRYEGMGFDPHVDILNFANTIYNNEIEKDSELEKVVLIEPRFGFIIYFNDDYTGGEICYPEFDFCYKPNAGDLVIHDIKSVHAVKKVKSGARYTHSAQLSDNFYVTKETHALIDWPETEFTLDDPKFHYTVRHGKSNNIRLAKFMESYIDEHLYS